MRISTTLIRMNKKSLAFIALVMATACSCGTFTKVTGPSASKQFKNDGYKLVWADEFNQNGPVNAQNWQFEQGFKRNGELQWYQKENAWCQNGHLIIEARRESKINSDYQPGSKDWRKNRENIN